MDGSNISPGELFLPAKRKVMGESRKEQIYQLIHEIFQLFAAQSRDRVT